MTYCGGGMPTRRASQPTKGWLVLSKNEAILTAEQGAWVEEMTEAMHDLDDAQRGDPAGIGGQR